MHKLDHAELERPEQAPRLAHFRHPKHIWPRRVGGAAVQVPERCSEKKMP